jgi:carboxyl-terminal processing protease
MVGKINISLFKKTEGPGYRIVALILFVLFFQFGFAEVPEAAAVAAAGAENDAESVLADPAVVEEVRDIIIADYPMEISQAVMEAATVPEMLDALGDPYAHYLQTRDFTNLMNVINMSFVGIGVVLDDHSEGIVVSQVILGGPAAEAGIRAGDILVSVDGVDLKGKSCQESVSLLKGEAGSMVELCYCRGEETLTVHLERRAVQIPQVVGDVFDSVGVVTVSSFGMGMEWEFAGTVQALREQGARSWVIDLRGNGGGLVDTALEMLGFFIGGQDAVVWQTSKEKSSEKAVPQVFTIDEPVIVLADGMTASASEIVIGALRDYEKAVVLGERTYGSGRFKQVFPLSNGDFFMMTISRFYTPKENPVDFIGLLPDLQLSEDEVLTAAKMLLKNHPFDRDEGTGDGEATDTDGNIDAGVLGVAVSRDETGYLRWQVGAQSFRVSLSDWHMEENWSAGQELIDQCLGNTSVSVGTEQGWQEVSEEDLLRRWPVYFPGYQPLDILDVACPQDMISREIVSSQDMTPWETVFVQAVLPDNLLPYMSQAELIDAASGQRIEASCCLRDQGMELAASSSLLPDHQYWLVIADGDGGGTVGQLTINSPIVE